MMGLAFLLEWAGIAVSLFNTILLLWLGFTILLNAQRRTWGIWLAGGAFMLGGAFFTWHSALLRYRLDYIVQQKLSWGIGWIPVTVLPIAWYIITLWYSGYWDHIDSKLRRRQRPWFFAIAALVVVIAALIAFSGFSPLLVSSGGYGLANLQDLRDAPLQVLIYPVYIILCISASLDALARPEPSGRMMRDVARKRARPWLMATGVVLLIVSLLVVAGMLWIVMNVSPRTHYDAKLYTLSTRLAMLDIVISSLLALATVTAGQGVVQYEIFTGKTLPRRGITRHWRNAIMLAAGYGAAAGLGSTLHLPAIYGLLLTTVLMVLFYALLGWRSYGERERYMARLRPFVASQQLYTHVLTGSASEPSDVDVATPFRALCSEVLGADIAYLHPLGPLASLTGPLSYPNGGSPGAPWLADVIAEFRSPDIVCTPLDPARHNGLIWAVPLWGERGLIGVMLLGEKRDGSLYADEEIEIARAVGERLIDTQSSAEIARRLMALQRQRLAESQVLDQTARRVLHDDVLPQLHAAMLALSSNETGRQESVDLLGDAHRRISDLLREMPATTGAQVARIGLIAALRQVVGNQLAGSFDEVTWRVDSDAERRSMDIPTMAAEVAFYAAREAMRNAARHGRGGSQNRPLHLTIEAVWRDGLRLTIEDDGVGVGGSEESGGSGQGLALHSTMMAVVGGSLETESAPGRYTRVVVKVR